MNQYEFDKLLERYLAGQCSAEEELQLNEWADKTLLESDAKLSTTEQKKLEKQLWKRIRSRVFPIKFYQHRWVMAASVLIAVAAFAFWGMKQSDEFTFFEPKETLVNRLGVIEMKNTSDKPQKIRLEDGSEVVLKVQSSISYPEHFNDKTRNVYLKGEAFFHVKRNPSKPFIVHTGDLVTEVLGTSFTIKAYDEVKSIEVLVATGKVSVYEDAGKSTKHRNGVILTPNQKIVFDKESKKLSPSLVENPVIVNPPKEPIEFIFEESPLASVLERLREAYQIEFIIENHQLTTCSFTADLNGLSLHTQLDLICKSINANYEQRGTVIFINGVGCK